MNEAEQRPQRAEAAPAGRAIAAAGAAALVAAGAWLLRSPMVPSDPWHYSRHAWAIATGAGPWDPAGEPVFGHRLAVTMPLGLIYKVAGVSDFSTAVWFIACAAGLAFLVCRAASAIHARCGVLALVLCATSPLLMVGAATPFPDIVCAMFLFAGAEALRRSRIDGSPPMASLAAASIVLALLAKPTAVWAAPFIAGLFVRDLAKGDACRRRAQLVFAGVGMALGAAYMAFLASTTGDVLAPVRAVESFAGKHLWSADSTAALAKRLLVDPWWWLPAALGWPLAGAAAALAAGTSVPRFWKWWFATLLAGWWLGTTTLSRWDPVPLVDRMVLPVLPGAIVVASSLAAPGALERIGRRRMAAAAAAVALLLAAYLAPLAAMGPARKMFLVSAATAGAWFFPFLAAGLRMPARARAVLSAVAIAGGGALLLLAKATTTKAAHEGAWSAAAYREALALVVEESGSGGETWLLSTDSRTHEFAAYGFGYELPAGWRHGHLAPDTDIGRLATEATVWVLDNERLNAFVAASYPEERIMPLPTGPVAFRRSGVTLLRFFPHGEGDRPAVSFAPPGAVPQSPRNDEPEEQTP